MPQESFPIIFKHIWSSSSPNFLYKHYYMGRVAKWGTMLGAFDIKYLPCTAIKGQILADLDTKFTKEREKDGTEEGGTLEIKLSGHQ